MSWQSARKAAQRWLDTLKLPLGDLSGQTIDLTVEASALRGEAKYRAMIIRAAKRILAARGIVATIEEPKPLGLLAAEDEEL